MSALNEITRQLIAEYERTAHLTSRVAELTEKLALAHQHAETLQAQLSAMQTLLNECRDELPDGMTLREHEEFERWCDMREDYERRDYE